MPATRAASEEPATASPLPRCARTSGMWASTVAAGTSDARRLPPRAGANEQPGGLRCDDEHGEVVRRDRQRRNDGPPREPLPVPRSASAKASTERRRGARGARTTEPPASTRRETGWSRRAPRRPRPPFATRARRRRGTRPGSSRSPRARRATASRPRRARRPSSRATRRRSRGTASPRSAGSRRARRRGCDRAATR